MVLLFHMLLTSLPFCNKPKESQHLLGFAYLRKQFSRKCERKKFHFNPICSKLIILQQKKLFYVYLFLFDGASKNTL
jgi:hypothetical protein